MMEIISRSVLKSISLSNYFRMDIVYYVATQDWFPLELINDEAPEHLDFVFAPSCEKEIFKKYNKENLLKDL